MNPDINKGIELNPQTELSPILALVSELEKNDYFLKLLARELDVAPEDILDFDFYVYNWEKSCLLGAENEFLSAPRLDNLTSVFACISSIISSENKDTIRLISLYDNEEIGSRTKQGGDSTATMLLLEKLYTALGYSKIEYHDALFQSFFLSADVAHGLHPNYVGKCDPTHQPRLGDGVVLKINYSQQYATDVEALAAIKQLCSKKNIPYQEFVNRSDMPCGSTLGSIVSSWLPVRTVDLGVPLLAMHSCRELMGCDDQDALHRLITSFFDV
jgi:aspartyl aminopeptidase